MDRKEALDLAVKHVDTLSKNSRGYADGNNLPERAAAVERFARFLMGESRDDR